MYSDPSSNDRAAAVGRLCHGLSVWLMWYSYLVAQAEELRMQSDYTVQYTVHPRVPPPASLARALGGVPISGLAQTQRLHVHLQPSPWQPQPGPSLYRGLCTIHHAGVVEGRQRFVRLRSGCWQDIEARQGGSHKRLLLRMLTRCGLDLIRGPSYTS